MFDRTRPIGPSNIEELLGYIGASSLKRAVSQLRERSDSFSGISQKLGEAIIDALANRHENITALKVVESAIDKPTRFVDARALEISAIDLALKFFSAKEGAAQLDIPEDSVSGLASIRVMEDALIEHEARTIPGWQLSTSDVTGRAVFKKGREELEVITANKRPLEEIFGVDLIYLNRARGSLVMVQYKMMEPIGRPSDDHMHEKEWLVRLDDQFRDEIARMKRFDAADDPGGPYRLHPGAFFFKLVKRFHSTESAGLLLSLGHLQKLMAEDALKGPKGGARISYQGLDGHYLRSEAFVELVRSGYVGSRGATTEHLNTLLDAAILGQRAVVAAIQSVIVPVAEQL